MLTTTSYRARLGLTLLMIVMIGWLLLTAWRAAVVHASAAPRAPKADSADWIILVNLTGTLEMIDTATDTVHGPFLAGELGESGGALLDVAVTPDGRTALITNFGYQAVYFVDVTQPLTPSVITSVTLPLLAEDIALTHDGRFAVVTDGGTDSPIVSVDVLSRRLAYTLSLPALNAQAVDIAPDGTVITVDFWNGMIHALRIDAAGALTLTHTYTYTLKPDGRVGGEISPHPSNVGIAPDGQTVIICDGFAYNPPANSRFDAGVYRITAPGVLSFTGVITGLTRAPQSVAFSADGHEAYLHGNSGNNVLDDTDELAVLTIDGPGQVRLKANDTADLLRITEGQLYGVDTIAVANGKAYLGYPVAFIDWSTPNFVPIVDLSNGTTITRVVSDLPTGVAVIPAPAPPGPPIFRLWLPLLAQ